MDALLGEEEAGEIGCRERHLETEQDPSKSQADASRTRNPTEQERYGSRAFFDVSCKAK
jgi:hypothetical protein